MLYDENSVVQRQRYLITHGHPPQLAYDTARKEFYRHRHQVEIATRVAREEALAVGAFFGPGPLEVGMGLEDRAYEQWKGWAEKEVAAMKQMAGAAYTGTETESGREGLDVPEGPGVEAEELQEVAGSVPASSRGQLAQGGAGVHP